MPARVLTEKKNGNEEKPWRVVGQTTKRGRVYFSGLEADAREYVQNNFPRPHVDEFTADPNNPVHDVKLVAPDGSEYVFNSKDGWGDKPNYGEAGGEENADV